ncbi:MAG: hypothetical protein M1834_005594 [Cirrosporium novae-zelandiae]|nr:MAG: hypothetical protein M1834_005594 [Cirrosporium novae-zelandiae]
MEALAAASSVFAVVSLAGQCLEGLTSLQSFFDDALDWPRDIRLLRDEIIISHATVQNIAKYAKSEDLANQGRDAFAIDTLLSGLRLYDERIRLLQSLIDKFGIKHHGRGKMLVQFKAAYNALKIEKELSGFQRARNLVEQAQSTLFGISNSYIQRDIKTIESEMKQVSLTTEQSFQQNVATTTIIREMDGRLGQVQDVTNESKDLLQSLFGPGFADQLVAKMLPSFKEHICSIVREEMKPPETVQELPDSVSVDYGEEPDCLPQPDDLGSTMGNEPSEKEIQSIDLSTPEDLLDAYRHFPMGFTKRLIREVGAIQRYSAWFGRITYRTTTATSFEEDLITHEKTNFRCYKEIFISLAPAPWVMSWISLSKLSWLAYTVHNPSFNLFVEPVRIVPNSAPIWDACLRGDLACVRQLLNSGQASIYDRTANGENLAHACLEFQDIGGVAPYDNAEGKWRTAQYLIGSGVDSMEEVTESKESPVQRFLDRWLRLITIKPSDTSAEVCQNLLSTMFRSAESDPLFVDSKSQSALSTLELDDGYWGLVVHYLSTQDEWTIDWNVMGAEQPLLHSIVRDMLRLRKPSSYVFNMSSPTAIIPDIHRLLDVDIPCLRRILALGDNSSTTTDLHWTGEPILSMTLRVASKLISEFQSNPSCYAECVSGIRKALPQILALLIRFGGEDPWGKGCLCDRDSVRRGREYLEYQACDHGDWTNFPQGKVEMRLGEMARRLGVGDLWERALRHCGLGVQEQDGSGSGSAGYISDGDDDDDDGTESIYEIPPEKL